MLAPKNNPTLSRFARATLRIRRWLTDTGCGAILVAMVITATMMMLAYLAAYWLFESEPLAPAGNDVVAASAQQARFQQQFARQWHTVPQPHNTA